MRKSISIKIININKVDKKMTHCGDTDHPHLVNFPWRGPPHERPAAGPHGPL